MNKIKAYLGVARGPFLLLPFTLIASGAAAASYHGMFSGWRTLLALVGLLALHMAVNAFNEASDMRTGIDLHTIRTPFSGGSGTIPAGALSVGATRVFAYACAAVGLATGIVFLLTVGWVMLPIMVAGALCVLIYTDVLARAGVGEIAAGLGLGALPVAGAAIVQNGSLGRAAVAASVPAFFMTFNLLLLNEFPDEEADLAGGRRHLVILLGRRGAAWVYSAAAILTPISIVAAVGLGALPVLALVAVLPSLLLARPLAWAFGKPLEPVPIPAMGANVIWNLATNVVLAVALVLSRTA